MCQLLAHRPVPREPPLPSLPPTSLSPPSSPPDDAHHARVADAPSLLPTRTQAHDYACFGYDASECLGQLQSTSAAGWSNLTDPATNGAFEGLELDAPATLRFSPPVPRAPSDSSKPVNDGGPGKAQHSTRSSMAQQVLRRSSDGSSTSGANDECKPATVIDLLMRSARLPAALYCAAFHREEVQIGDLCGLEKHDRYGHAALLETFAQLNVSDAAHASALADAVRARCVEMRSRSARSHAKARRPAPRPPS